MRHITILLMTILGCSLYAQHVPSVIVIDDAEKPRMSRWKMLGPAVPDTGVDYISSEKERKKVIRLRGDELNNEFVLKGDKGHDLNLKGHRVLEWKMNFSRPFVIKVDLVTTDGIKHLLYTDMSDNFRSSNDYLHIGLGSRYRDGKWRTVIRDLQLDLDSMLKKVKLMSIQSISFRGTGYIDDIWALDVFPRDIILENGENELRGWDKIGKGGSLNIDFDTVLGEVVKFDSGSKNAIFRLRKQGGSYWKIKSNVVIQWKLKTRSDVTLYVIGEASNKGKYAVAYTFGRKAPFYEKKDNTVYYSVGEDNKDGAWHVFTRDIANDVRSVLPGVDVVTVGSVLVKGAGLVDDIKLMVEHPMELDLLKGWEVYDADPSGARIDVFNDVEKGNVVELSGNGVKNGYRYKVPAGLSSSKQKYINWDLWSSEPFDMILAVNTGGLVRYVHYVALKETHQNIKDGELYIGIGETKTDGKWYNISRNIEEDIKKLGNDVGFVSCEYFLVRGNCKVGKISFSDVDPKGLAQSGSPSAVSSMVLGQHDLYRNLRNLWDSDTAFMDGLYYPQDVVSDKNGGIYVADTDNNRILYWNQKPINYGASANIEFNFENGLKSPKALAFLSSDKLLAVADSGNNRVLIFKLPLDESSRPVRTISGLRDPSDIFYDGQRFFIADTGNNRVLVWKGIPEKDDAPFNVVLGQSSISGVSPNKGDKKPNYNTMMYPCSLYSDGQTLYVSDTGNNRVLVFDKIPEMNGWHADRVIGQRKFKDGLQNRDGKVSSEGLSSPKGIIIDKGLLFISDTGNNRIMILKDDGNGAWSTVGVIGQSNYSSSMKNAPLGIPTPGSLYSPSNVFIRDGIIYVADTLNNRVLVY